MKLHVQRRVTGIAAVGLMLSLGATPAYADDEYKVLVVGDTLGYRHSHIDDTTLAVIQLGQENGFTVDVWGPRQTTRTLAATPFTTAEDLSQ